MPDDVRDDETTPRSATIIPFVPRAARRYGSSTQPAGVSPAIVGALLDAAADATTAQHAPTRLAAIGAVAGFAAQQSLLIAGGGAWVQPSRSGHLDRLLMSETIQDHSLWRAIKTAAHATGAHNLPDPEKLLASTVKCVGTDQLGRIIMPLEYRLVQQPQTMLIERWSDIVETFDAAGVTTPRWPAVAAEAAARLLCSCHRAVPPHVGVRVVMQAALAMALIDPRTIPGAAVKPGVERQA